MVIVLSFFTAGIGTALIGPTLAGTTAISAGTLVAGSTAVTWGSIAAGAAIGATAGGLGAALAGGDIGDILRGAAVGAVQGAISAGALHSMESATSISGQAAHVVGHGVVGGAANEAMGGKFADGFLSAAAAAAAVHTGLYGAFKGTSAVSVAGRTAIAGMIGGTASALGGGKFANGAYTAAFQHLLNAEAPNFLEDQAVGAGLVWLKGGNAGKTYTFNESTQMGKDLLKFPEVNQAMQDAYSNPGIVKEWSRNLGKENPVSYVKSFAKDFFGDNRTRALHGSIRGTTIFKNGTFHIKAKDTLGWVSFTHEPVTITRALQLDKLGLFTGKTYADNYLIENNKFGANGIGGNTVIQYNLKIKVY